MESLPPVSVKRRFRDYVLTGLTALLPLWLTLYIVWFLVKLTGNIIFPVVRPVLQRLLQRSPPEELLLAMSAIVVCFLIMMSSRDSFQSVVRVEFPVAGQYSSGLVTSGGLSTKDGVRLVSVIVSTAPNPTSGFLIFIPREKLQYLPMSVDEAMTLLLSMGTLGPRVLGDTTPD